MENCCAAGPRRNRERSRSSFRPFSHFLWVFFTVKKFSTDFVRFFRFPHSVSTNFLVCFRKEKKSNFTVLISVYLYVYAHMCVRLICGVLDFCLLGSIGQAVELSNRKNRVCWGSNIRKQ